MALITDTIESLKTEKMFTITGENWRQYPPSNDTHPVWVAISGTVTAGLPSYENAFSTKLSADGGALKIVSDNPEINDKEVHRIVAETFWEQCFLASYYTADDKKDLELYLSDPGHRQWTNLHTSDKADAMWMVHHKDNNANNNSVPNLVWLRACDHRTVHSHQTFDFAGL